MKPASLYLLVALSASALLSSCSSAPPTGETPASVAEIPAPTPIPATATSEPQEVDNCLTCHQDKQMLIDTARQEDEVASENSGEG